MHAVRGHECREDQEEEGVYVYIHLVFRFPRSTSVFTLASHPHPSPFLMFPFSESSKSPVHCKRSRRNVLWMCPRLQSHATPPIPELSKHSASPTRRPLIGVSPGHVISASAARLDNVFFLYPLFTFQNELIALTHSFPLLFLFSYG